MRRGPGTVGPVPSGPGRKSSRCAPNRGRTATNAVTDIEGPSPTGAGCLPGTDFQHELSGPDRPDLKEGDSIYREPAEQVGRPDYAARVRRATAGACRTHRSHGRAGSEPGR